MNVYTDDELDPVPSKPKTVVKTLAERVDEVVLGGGELVEECSIEEYGEFFGKYKKYRRQCVVSIEYLDGKVYVNSRLQSN